jgi:catechol 2,3-dioxygenase-like lactoylglutathione lyase family enzyme
MTDTPPTPPLGENPEVPVAPPPAAPAAAPRRMRITGIHHVTLISGDLARTTAFYRDLLGFALWREAANDDDPGARHFWFAADPAGAPGTVLSFLEYPQMGTGTQGTGATHHLALAVGSPEEVGAWRDYLRSRDVPTTEVFERGGLTSVYLRDPDGHILEITAPAAG